MAKYLVPDLIASVGYARDAHEALITLRATVMLERDTGFAQERADAAFRKLATAMGYEVERATEPLKVA